MKRLVKKALSACGLAVSRAPRAGQPVCWPTNARAPQTFFEADSEFHERYDLAQQRTQMWSTDNALRRNRHYFLYHLIRSAPIARGHVVELGCWRGLSAFQIARHLSEHRGTLGSHKFFIFDSFEGLSPIHDADRGNGDGPHREAEDRRRREFAASLDTVRRNLADFEDLLVYFKGWIPERFPEVAADTFSFVHVDVDLYEPIKHSIEFFYPRLVANGIMVFDDYGCPQFPGAKRAVDEFLSTASDCLFVPTTSGSAFLVKS